MSKANMVVTVSTLETEYDMKLEPKATGKHLMDAVLATTGIREHWWFGLSFTSQDGEEDWLKNEKKISKQNVPMHNKKYKFVFKFRFFPEHVEDEVYQDVTLRLLYRQIKNDVIAEKLHCPSEKAIMLASYQVQLQLGDYNSETHPTGYLSGMMDKIFPTCTMSQHSLSVQEWEEKVSKLHQKHQGLNREEAMAAYMKIAGDLDMYGITYFTVFNAKNKELLLGVDSTGLNCYTKDNKLNPSISFPWSEIARLKTNKNEFVCRFNDTKDKPYKARGKNPKSAVRILACAHGNHELYNTRRKADTLEVQQMKGERDDAKKRRKEEKEAMQREMQARLRLEKKQAEMEKKFKELQEEMEARRQELEESRANIDELEKKLKEVEASRLELERQQQELRDMLEKLENDRNMEAEERKKLEEEIQAKQLEIEEVKGEVDSRAEETKRLQEEMEEARRKLEVSAEAMQQTPAILAIDDDDNQIPEIIVSNEDDEINHGKEIKELREELFASTVEEELSSEDKQYRENLSHGRDKFKTLKEVRKGNTVRRIDMFENM